jgi:spermidine/putrescine transport system ATP-binding protein
MNEGRVEQLGTPRDIYARPATRFVAGFIGTSNILSGPVTSAAGGSVVILDGDGQHVEATLRDGLSLSAGDTAEITVRPEKVSIKPDADGCAGCRLRGTVTEVVYLGTSTNYNVVTSTGDEITVFVQNSDDSAELAERGADVWLTWDPRHSYVIGAQ